MSKYGSFSFPTKLLTIPAYRSPEWQADAFGGELLMPAHLIADMTVEEVMNK